MVGRIWRTGEGEEKRESGVCGWVFVLGWDGMGCGYGYGYE